MIKKREAFEASLKFVFISILYNCITRLPELTWHRPLLQNRQY